jgi:hypothetical protein
LLPMLCKKSTVMSEISTLSTFRAPVAAPLLVLSRKVEHFTNWCTLVRIEEGLHP